VQFASDPRKRRQTGKNRIRTLAPTWQNTYYLEHTGLFRVSLSHIFKAPDYGKDFRFLQNAVGFFGSQQDDLNEFMVRHDSPL